MKQIRCFLPVILLFVGITLHAATEIGNLRVEYRKNPTGIDTQNPQFSWEMKSEITGAKQTAYEIRLFAGDSNSPFWNSGKIISGHSLGIAYAGSPLSPSTRYRWTVDVWDKEGAKISASEDAFFETGLMQSGWSDAKWLKMKDKVPDGQPANFTLSCDMTIIDQNAGVIFGAQDVNNMYMWAINTYGTANNRPALRRHIFTGGNVRAEDVPLPFTAAQLIGHEKRLKIEVVDNVIKTYLDNTLVDTYSSPALKNGYIGFRVYTGENNTHEHACIDNVVYDYYENGILKTFTEDFENGSNDFDGTDTILVDGNSKMDLQAQGNADFRVLQSAAYGIPLFRTEFPLAKAIRSARIYTSALGIYDLFVNGQRVGTLQPDGTMACDELKPGWTDYRKTVFYSTYDITNLLVNGRNVVGAEVSPGWFTGNIAHNEYGQHPLAFLAKILLEYTDGTKETLVTNPFEWKATTHSAIRTADIYDGETYDARKESEWKTASYDDGEWLPAEISDSFKGDILAFIGQPVRVRRELEQTPQVITVHKGTVANGTSYGKVNVLRTLSNTNAFSLAKGETAVVDFGQNFAGWINFKVTGISGARLTARFAEMLNDSGAENRGNDNAQGTLYLRNLRSAKATLRYTLRGDAQGETFHPTMTFFGFRYCEITATEDITIENLKGEVVGNVNEESSTFTTSNKLVNRLYENIIWGQRGNFLSVPTDCPQRDERLGWMGDTQIFSRAAAYNADVLPFFHKWARDVRDSQQSDGTYPSVVPDNWNVGYGRTAWAEAGIIVPWNMYLMYGDSRLLGEQYASMEKFMDWLATRQFDGYLYNGGDTQYGDWLAYEATDARFISVCYYAYAAQLMAKISAALNQPQNVVKYRTLYDQIKEEFQRRYISSRNGTLLVTSQTAYLLALKNNLLPDSTKTQTALTALTAKIRSNANKLSTGFVGTGILNQTLSEFGVHETAYNLLMQRENPSWLYSVDQGATTIWERWNSYTIASGFGDPSMNSFNHYSYGAVSEWMFRFMAGIEADENIPGFKHFLLQPVPDVRNVPDNERITFVCAEYGSYYGKIKSRWEYREDGNYRYTVTVPPNTGATLCLPKCNGAIRVTQKGVAAETVEGVISYVDEDERFVLELESGTYVFDTQNTDEPGIIWPEGQLLPTFPAPAQKQDLIYLNNNTDAELYLFSSLKGLVNRTQPRIFSYEGDAFAEGAYTWLQSLGMSYSETTPWSVLSKYKSEISGLIVYDPSQIHTVNLAARMAKGLNALIAAPSLLARLQAEPYGFPVLADLRGQYTSSLQVYQAIFDNYWPGTDKRLLIGLSPTEHKASLREYAVALGAAVVWLDPKKSAESDLLNRFLASMPAGANYMGWWPEEQPGVDRVSNYGFTTIASDFCTNLTFHSGTPRRIEPRPMPAKPALENKIYVAFILSDGDNLQYVEHLMRKLWNNPDRGSVPMGWTLSPAMADAMPGALNYYHQSASDNDNLISGPSGYGYTYPNNWVNSSLSGALADFAAQTEKYNVQAGFRVITVWNTITGGINGNVGNIFAANAPTLLGLTAQNTGGSLVIYDGKLPGRPLTCNYCTNEQAMREHIENASKSWLSGSKRNPLFLIIQAQPWNGVTPTSFKNVANALGSDYAVVRPDHIFQLIREHNHLPVNPGGVEGEGDGLTGTYFNGSNFETEVTSRTDACVDFDWGYGSPLEGVNVDEFSVRWSGSVMPGYTGTYTFYVTCDDGCRLWVNNQLIIDKWISSAGAEYSGALSLTAGEKYDLKLEYYERRNTAICRLEWASPFQSREVIPKNQLFSDSYSGLEKVYSSPGIKIYSHRFEKGIVTVEAGNNSCNEAINITVYDMYGKIVLQQAGKERKQQLDLSRRSKGIYLISVRIGNDSKTIKFIQS